MDYEIMMNGNVKIGTYAPDFEAETTMGKIELNQYKGKWVILFSHPGDFTPVQSFNLGKYEKSLILPFSAWEEDIQFAITHKNCTAYSINSKGTSKIYLRDLKWSK